MNLEVNKITKSFGANKVLDNTQLHLQQDEIVGIFGRNGSGKSTLLKIIFGTLKAQKVELKINAKFIPQNKIIPQKWIAYLPQFNFLPKNTIIRNIIPMYFQDGDQQDKIFYSPKVAEFEGLRPAELSIGQLKYLEILLIANLPHPFIILDEPFSMVDPLFKELIKEQLIKLKPTKGIIITDHYYKDVLQITDRNYLLKDGSILPVSNELELSRYGYLSCPLNGPVSKR